MSDARYFVQKRQIATRISDDFITDLTLAQGLNAFLLTLQNKLAILENVDPDDLHVNSFKVINLGKDTNYFDLEYEYEIKFLEEDIKNAFAKVLAEKYEGKIASMYCSSGYSEYILVDVNIPKKYVGDIMQPFGDVKLRNELRESVPKLYSKIFVSFNAVDD